MWYIFNKDGNCTVKTAYKPDTSDINLRHEEMIQSDNDYDMLSIILFNGEIVSKLEFPPTSEEIQKQLTDAVQSYMDSKVRERGYDNIHTACSYAVSTSEKFKAEGEACVIWRDTIWLTCYSILDEVMTGEREVPTVEELLAELPVLEW